MGCRHRHRGLLAASLLLSACGDPLASDKCNDLVGSLCANAEEACLPPGDADACEEELEEVFSCEDALDVGPGYDACMDRVLGSQECLLDVGLPEECEGVVRLPE